MKPALGYYYQADITLCDLKCLIPCEGYLIVFRFVATVQDNKIQQLEAELGMWLVRIIITMTVVIILNLHCWST